MLHIYIYIYIYMYIYIYIYIYIYDISRLRVNLFQVYSVIRRMKRFDTVYTNNSLITVSMSDWLPLVCENCLLWYCMMVLQSMLI